MHLRAGGQFHRNTPMVTDMLGGTIRASVHALPNSLPHIQRGTLRALAVIDAVRSPALPDVPTVGETLAGFDVTRRSMPASPIPPWRGGSPRSALRRSS